MENKKILTLIFLFAVVVLPFTSMGVTAQVLPICDDTPQVTTNCTMLTPALNCTDAGFTYDIINATGDTIVSNDALFVFNNDIFFFNFTEPKGDYIVRLCDASTREVFVGGDPVSFETGASILFVAAMVALGFFGFIINQIDLPADSSKKNFFKIINALLSSVKNLFFLMIIWLPTLGIGLAGELAENSGATAGVVNQLNTAYTIFLWLSVLATIFLLIAAFIGFLSRFLDFGDPRNYRGRRLR